MRIYAVSFLIGIGGAALAWLLKFPAPFLTGPAFFVSLAGVLGVKTDVPDIVRNVVFVIIGLALGSSVTPEILAAAAAWPASLIGMCAGVALIMLTGGFMFQRYFAMDRETAYLASSPGHLSYVLGFSTDVGADTAMISMVQSIRVLFLTLLVPVAVALLTDADMTMPIPVDTLLSPMHLGILAVLGTGLGLVFLKLKLPAALLLSSMFVSSFGHGSGLTPGQVPTVLSVIAFVTMGTLIGSRFSGVSLAMLRRAAVAGLLFTLLALVIAVVFAGLVSLFTHLPFLDVIIAFAPGGLETMVAMAAIVQADPAYVALHHVARLFFLSAFVPFVLTWNRNKR
ncbi:MULTISPECIES: AbrB family transcriptional regulator [Halocynthiibacter]|uniref:AbrB family transcriptional regulator n=1 Tax=Halocynthiibacter halioticoli TaxID=2986804 RepID=A0AAE3IZ14_9RHOB|nr:MULTISPECIES: AbrB family transcriptional regulator [Halocynthiibacter]MCV6823745.1 AbrB family transcriptional regulator [Halocynthiibacter halioticoli]MCW4056746.1 AbrB family transcriptional regulator [Halocynthiibacter sp. SDUM655004]